jgi:glycosyltransferase involved in cell wall biosynthesis
MSLPRFTFCIPNLNKIKYLPDCIQGMLEQESADWCCVFVDGYSTDGSWEYMQQFRGDSRFKLLQGKRQGMYEDWNECLRNVDTEYFYFLTSDDTCFPELVGRTISALDRYPEINACHFLYSFIDEDGKTTHTPRQVIQENFPIYQKPNQSSHIRSGLCEFMMHFAYHNIYRTMTSLVMRKTLIPQLKSFSSQYGSAGDFDWTMRLCLHTDVLFIPELLATWRLYESQATQIAGGKQLSSDVMAAALENLDLFLDMHAGELFYKKINIGKLQSRLEDNHAASILRSVDLVDNLPSIQYLIDLFRKYPFYIFQKLLNRFTLNLYNPYVNNDTFAMTLIAEGSFIWPPEVLQPLAFSPSY